MNKGKLLDKATSIYKMLEIISVSVMFIIKLDINNKNPPCDSTAKILGIQ